VSAWAQNVTIDAGRRLEAEGKLREAFEAYLNAPQATHLAVGIARPRAPEYLPIIDTLLSADTIPSRRAQLLLIRGDLYLALGYKTAALDCYRQVSNFYLGRADYPPEPVPDRLEGTREGGSERDNWLIRRFLSLDADADALAEYERVWRNQAAISLRDVEFMASLQFTLDYARALRKRSQFARALDILQHQILRIDLDRVQGYRASGRHSLPLESAGLTSAAFLYGAWQEFVAAGAEARIMTAVEQSAQPQAKRVLARLLLQQGKLDASLSTELEYASSSRFSEISRTYRRGLAYQEFSRPAEAAAEFQKALAAPFEKLDIPEAELVQIAARQVTEAALRRRLQSRMMRLYAILGDRESELRAASALLATEDTLNSLLELDQLHDRFMLAGRGPEFREILSAQLPRITQHLTRANIHWELGDTASTAIELALQQKPDFYEMERWKRMFRELGPERLRSLLEALAKARPKDVYSRAEFLATPPVPNSVGTVAQLEALLDPSLPSHYFLGKGLDNRTPLRNVWDVAAHLAHVYERAREWEKLNALGSRIVSFPTRFQLPDSAHEALALVIRHAQTEQLDELAKLLSAPAWARSRAQLERRRSGMPAHPTRPDFGWANSLPEGTKVLAINDKILSLTSDSSRVYAGHSWGVAIYDHSGNPITRIAIGHPVNALAVTDGALWASANRGLLRIDLSNFAVARVQSQHLDGNIAALAVHNGSLWIAGRSVARLDPRSRELHLFAPAEMEDDRGPFDKFLLDGPYVWIDGNAESGSAHRYDTRSGRWHTPDGARVNLLGIFNGVLWATLRAHPPTPQRIRLGGPRVPAPEKQAGSRLFHVHRETLAVDAVTGGIGGSMLDERAAQFQKGNKTLRGCGWVAWIQPDGVMRCGGDGLYQRLTEGGVLANDGVPGSLRFLSANGELRRDSAAAALADMLPGSVNDALQDSDGMIWAATDGGLALLDASFKVRRVFNHDDGLITVRFNAGVVRERKLFFAGEGRVTVFDPETAVFTSHNEDDIARPQPPRIGVGDMPWLGGPILADLRIEGKRVLCGARGIAVVNAGTSPVAQTGIYNVREYGMPLFTSAESLVAATPATPQRARLLLANPNPYIRERTLAGMRDKTGPEWVAALGSTPDDPHPVVRRSAVRIIARSALPEWRAFLQKGLRDPDRRIRGLCAEGLVKLGVPVSIQDIEFALTQPGVDVVPLYRLLVSTPNVEAVSLLLRRNHFPMDGEWAPLAEDLCRNLPGHAASLDLILRAPNDAYGPGPAPPIIARCVQAFPPTRLHAALESGEYQVEVNAARALALRKDRTATPFLLSAVARNSRSRTAILHSLVDLRDPQASARLEAMYAAFAPSPASMRGTWIQAQARGYGHWSFDAFQPFDAVSYDYETPMHEQLLTALAGIGATSQEFYRRLALSADSDRRTEAAKHLNDRNTLQRLLDDPDPRTKVNAAITLLLMGEEIAQPPVIRWMQSCQGPDAGALLANIHRVKDIRRLVFLKPAVERCRAEGRIPIIHSFEAGRILGPPQ